MKSIGAYSGRFRAMEIVSYFLLAVPWLAGAPWKNTFFGGTAGLLFKITLSSIIAVFIWLLRDLHKKAAALEAMKKNLSHAAIHDLKGPLTSIIGALSIVEEPGMDPVVREKLLKVAAQSSKDMIKLIRVLLDTERMETAAMILDRQKLSVWPLVKDALANLGTISEETGIGLTVLIGEDMPPLYADHDLMIRVLENLLLNAIKYSRRGDKIDLRVSYSRGEFNLEVSDTGIGIDPGNIEKVFEKYYRVEGQEAESRKGSGIGLYFCRLAVEAHKGKIYIKSDPGRGTRVTVNIPEGK
ncbi:MAG: HAMP domain-containing sensor histidine kinase, partial [Nitrospiraceae bacterium]|nr:HAMP domain-containing sensor histidine kinase [Nitrospiraceae bacterium]